MKKLEYSQIVRHKMMKLRSELTAKFGNEVSQKALKSITIAARGLLEFEDKGIAVSMMYDVECDYRRGRLLG